MRDSRKSNKIVKFSKKGGLLKEVLGIKNEDGEIHYFNAEIFQDYLNAYLKFTSHEKKDRKKFATLKTILQKKAERHNFYVGSYEETNKNNIFHLVIWVQFEQKLEVEKLELLIS